MKGQTWFYMPFVFFLNLSCTVHSDEGSDTAAKMSGFLYNNFCVGIMG